MVSENSLRADVDFYPPKLPSTLLSSKNLENYGSLNSYFIITSLLII